MTCRECGSAIADRALICYRCGAATTAPRTRPPGVSPAKGPWRLPALAGLVVLMAAGLYLGHASGNLVSPGVGGVLLLGVVGGLWIYRARRGSKRSSPE